MINFLIGLVAFLLIIGFWWCLGKLYHHCILLSIKSFWANVVAGLLISACIGLAFVAGLGMFLTLREMGGFILTLF